MNDAVQSWKFEDDGLWMAGTGGKSQLSTAVSTFERKKDDDLAVPVYGKRKHFEAKQVVLSSDIFSQVSDLWAIANKTYDKMRDRFKRQSRGTAISIKDWAPTGRQLTAEEEKMRQMTPNAQVVCTKRQNLATNCQREATNYQHFTKLTGN